MSCKINKKFTLAQGKENYYMITSDFGSLQMRLTTQDTSLNPTTRDNAQPCDPGLYDIYRADTECADAHSATAKMVFVDSIGAKLYDFELEDGSHIKLYQNMSAKVIRDGKMSVVKVTDILETDDFIEPIYEF